MTLTHKNNSERGFTIVELLIVIIVIGILATLVLIAYGNVQAQARDTKHRQDAISLRDAAAAFKLNDSSASYPLAGAGAASVSSSFAYSIANMTNKTVNVDSSVTDRVSANPPGTTAGTSGKDGIQVLYCGPSGSTAVNATGMKFVYWSEVNSNFGTPTVTTGTGC